MKHPNSRFFFYFAVSIVGFLDMAETVDGAPATPLSGEALYIADSYNDQVLCLIDRDSSGGIEPDAQGEVVPFYMDASPGPDLSIPSALVLGFQGEVFLLDGGTLDAVFILTDTDENIAANGENEWSVFYDDSSSGPNLSTPNDMTFGLAGELYISDDGRGAKQILRLLDQDGDGNALGEEEWLVVYDQSALSPPEGPLQDIEAISVLPDGRILAGDSTLERIYWMADANGDEDFLDVGEVEIFYDPQGEHEFNDLRGIVVGTDGVVFAAEADTGLVVRLEDLDQDGNALGAGEQIPFLDPDQPPFLQDAGNLALASDGTLVILDRRRDAVILAKDLDGDGTAMGNGEAISWLNDGGKLFSTPSAVTVGPAPREPDVAIFKIVPASGPITGSTLVHLSGIFSAPETAMVIFGDSPAEIVTASQEAIECLTPPGTEEGPVDVRVSTADGEAVLASGFSYHRSLFTRGDGNDDGELDISDVIAILTYLFIGGNPPNCEDAMDVDDDGELSITDAIYLLGFLFQGGTSIPPPGPGPGHDETPDNLTCGKEIP